MMSLVSPSARSARTASAATLEVAPAFGADDQRQHIDSRFADAPSRRFLQHAARGELQAMAEQVRAGYDINTAGSDGVTPAMAYVSYVRPVRRDVLAQFIALGADITRPLNNRMSLLNGLARLHDPNVLATLLHAGIPPNTRLPGTGQTWLQVAIGENNSELALGLLAAGADPRQRGGSEGAGSGAPLELALAVRNWVVADALIRAGADPREGDPTMRRLARALSLSPPAEGTAQSRARASVAAWLERQPAR